MEHLYDLIIIGSGPAGLSAAIYARRARLDALAIEASYVSGGQVVNTYEVDNYPGLPGISGMELGSTLRDHADRLGGQFVREKVQSLELEGPVKLVRTRKNEYRTKTVVLAMGAGHRKLGVPGEEEFGGMGVSYCATCDGAFFRDKVAAVAGGGDVAAEDAIFLARGCRKVYLIHRREELRAAMVLQEALKETPNVEILWNSVITEIRGETQVRSLCIRDVISGQERELPVDGCFIAVGITPNTQLLRDTGVELDDSGYIIAGEDGKTNVPGVFAAGDIRTKQLRQIITAAADGANCVTSAQNFLLTWKL